MYIGVIVFMVKNKLKVLLDNKGIKQTWLAQKANIDRSTLNAVIANKSSTNLETGLRIARALELQVEDIFELIDE
jgi:DNA-binding XRE family transcriptional regulator